MFEGRGRESSGVLTFHNLKDLFSNDQGWIFFSSRKSAALWVTFPSGWAVTLTPISERPEYQVVFRESWGTRITKCLHVPPRQAGNVSSDPGTGGVFFCRRLYESTTHLGQWVQTFPQSFLVAWTLLPKGLKEQLSLFFRVKNHRHISAVPFSLWGCCTSWTMSPDILAMFQVSWEYLKVNGSKANASHLWSGKPTITQFPTQNIGSSRAKTQTVITLATRCHNDLIWLRQRYKSKTKTRTGTGE